MHPLITDGPLDSTTYSREQLPMQSPDLAVRVPAMMRGAQPTQSALWAAVHAQLAYE